MEIRNSILWGMKIILQLYAAASEFQKSKAMVSWPQFDSQLIETEIREKRQNKMVVDINIACVWAIKESHSQIWGEKNILPALYLHHIATNPTFKGRNLVFDIVAWVKVFAKKKESTVYLHGYCGGKSRFDFTLQEMRFRLFGSIETRGYIGSSCTLPIGYREFLSNAYLRNYILQSKKNPTQYSTFYF